MVAMFVDGSVQNEQSLERTFHRCFLPSFTSFGWAVSDEKIKMWKVNGRQMTDAKWWQKGRWAKKNWPTRYNWNIVESGVKHHKTYPVCLVVHVERHFQQYFSYIVAVSFIGGGHRRTRRKLLTSHWQNLSHNVVHLSDRDSNSQHQW
jgi:hypothetical protein